MIEHFIKVECNSNNTCILLINDAWVDMIDGSAIYSDCTLNKSIINGRFSRCGMMYAGITDENRTNSVKKMADVICANVIRDCNINIIVHRRTIGSGANANGVCPSRVVSAITNAIEYCSISCVESYMNVLLDNDVSVLNTKIHGRDNDVVMHKGNIFDIPCIVYRTSTPLGNVESPKNNAMCVDTTTNNIYICTRADDVSAWSLLSNGENLNN